MAEMAPTPPVESPVGSRFECSQCESSFRRKEHLTRHLKTHDPQLSHVCTVCGKKFNRSDSLLRHLNKHGDGLKPSHRSKRACFACHAAKTKCDGGKPCQGCIKKGTECKYRQTNENQAPDEGDLALNELAISPAQERSPEEPSRQNGAYRNSPNDGSKNSFLTSRLENYVNWSTIRVEPDVSLELTPDEKYLDAYLTHFHHRHPIIHRPSYDDPLKGPIPKYFLLSMSMMGAWLEGSTSAREYAIASHQITMPQCLQEISKISAIDVFQQSFPARLAQAILINVVFTIYYGKERELSRGIMLFGMLVAALREARFFDPSQKWADEAPGYFLPMHWFKKGERERLAQCTFKIDAYLSMIRTTTRLITPEELIFGVPSSYSLANAAGLHILEERYINNPIARNYKTLYEMAEHVADPSSLPKDNVLIEDMQFALCCIHLSLCQLHLQVKNRMYEAGLLEAGRSCPNAKLDCIKYQLDQVTLSPLCPGLLAQYYGYEDHSEEGWERIVGARVNTLYFDTLMLYHLLNLQLYIDPNRLILVAKEFRFDLAKFSVEQQQIIGKRRCNTATWVSNPDSRRALCCAVDILAAMKSLQVRTLVDKERLDPICYIATSTAAMVVWAHVNFGIYTCRNCGPGMGFAFIEGNEVNLGPGDATKISKEDWIMNSLISRVQIDGVELCACTIGQILDKFKAFIPKEWELIGSISPCVFEENTLSKMVEMRNAAESHS